MRASEMCSRTSNIEVDSSHRMAPVRMMHIVILTFIEQGHKSSGNI